jgi:hypothetical protein
MSNEDDEYSKRPSWRWNTACPVAKVVSMIIKDGSQQRIPVDIAVSGCWLWRKGWDWSGCSGLADTVESDEDRGSRNSSHRHG